MASWQVNNPIRYDIPVIQGGDTVESGFYKTANEFNIVYEYLNNLRTHRASNSPPLDPELNELWLDTSVSPPTLKRWDGNNWVELTVKSQPNIADLTNATSDYPLPVGEVTKYRCFSAQYLPLRIKVEENAIYEIIVKPLYGTPSIYLFPNDTAYSNNFEARGFREGDGIQRIYYNNLPCIYLGRVKQGFLRATIYPQEIATLSMSFDRTYGPMYIGCSYITWPFGWLSLGTLSASPQLSGPDHIYLSADVLVKRLA